MNAAPGWYPDRDDPAQLRWWDGSQWTDLRAAAPAGPGVDRAVSLSAAMPSTRHTLQWRPGLMFWLIAPLFLIAALIGLGTGGVGSFLIIIGLVGVVTAGYALVRKRPSWASLPTSVGWRALVVAVSGLVLIGGTSAYGAAHHTPTRHGIVAAPTHTARDIAVRNEPTPTSTPTPPPEPVVLADYSGQSSAGAQSALLAAGFGVQMATSDGSAAPADWTGWTVASESPAPGQVTPGSTVRLVMSPPPPAPAPAPAAPAPAPAAPAPAPPAPAPAAPVDTTGGATALCNDGSLSFAAHHQGACSHHGGVAVFYK
jgi:resuscitation-promoting factor RpfB